MGTFTSPGPLDLLTFDLYDTLIELKPPRWERLAAAAAQIGIDADVDQLREADIVAEDYFTVQNGSVPIRDRAKPDQETFRLELMRIWLEAAGLPHDAETVRELRQLYISEFDERPYHEYYRLFDDVMPTLRRLRRAGLQTALISNADDDVTVVAVHFDFALLMDLLITSAFVGYEKPDPRTFQAALDPLGVDPQRTLHIGDQSKSDVVGARGVGMHAVLLDRYHRHPNTDIPTVNSLTELADKVLAAQPETVLRG